MFIVVTVRHREYSEGRAGEARHHDVHRDVVDLAETIARFVRETEGNVPQQGSWQSVGGSKPPIDTSNRYLVGSAVHLGLDNLLLIS